MFFNIEEYLHVSSNIFYNNKLTKKSSSQWLSQKKVVLFPEIGRVKVFLSLTRPRSLYIHSEYTFLISENNKETNKKTRIKKSKGN